MMSRLFRPLDRYVFGEFWKIFVVTALGFPILLIVIDLTDHVDQYLMVGKESGASDIHLAVNSRPIWRRFGNLEAIWLQAPVLTAADTVACPAVTRNRDRYSG